MVFLLSLLLSIFSIQKTLEDLRFLIGQFELVIYKNQPYLFTKQGYYSNLEGELSYTNFSSFPKELEDQQINFVKFLEHKDSIFGIHPGGGHLYKLDGDRLLAVDNSRPHLNQFASVMYSYRDTLFNLGGYGLWNSKSYMTYYDEKSKGWEKMNLGGVEPKNGFSAAQAILLDDVMHIIGGEFTLAHNQKPIKSDKIYRLDLKDKKWLEPFELTQDAFELVLSHFRTPPKQVFNFQDRIIRTPKAADPYFYQYDIKNNRIIISQEIKDVFYPDIIPMTFEGKIIEQQKNRNTPEITLQIMSLPSLITQEKAVTLYKTGDKTNMILAGCIVFLIGGLLFYKYQTSRKKITLTRSKLYYLGGSVPIKKSEYFFLVKLAQNRRVENQELLDYFFDQNRSSDLIIKRKNKMVEELSSRIYQEFKKHFFIKAPNRKDKRQAIYLLEKKYKILVEG